jgi:hypothetical protein
MTNQYIGCFSDCANGIRDIKNTSIDLNSLSPFTIEACINYCLTSGYIYAALQFG